MACEVAQVFEKELRKLERLHPQSPDYSVQTQYVQNIVNLPWNEYSKDNFNLSHAQKVLDRDHYGLEKVKERIIEHLAVLKLKGDMKSPIICLYGPPGVGKTSLGRSIAEALRRKYVRVSLGGLHDEPRSADIVVPISALCADVSSRIYRRREHRTLSLS